MWKGFGNLKTGLGDLTSKTLSTVAKAGNRAKEVRIIPIILSKCFRSSLKLIMMISLSGNLAMSLYQTL